MNKDQPKPEAEHQKLRLHLQKLGLKPRDLDEAAGPAAGGRSRREIAQTLIAWLRTLKSHG